MTCTCAELDLRRAGLYTEPSLVGSDVAILAVNTLDRYHCTQITDLYVYRSTAPLCFTIGSNVTSAPPFSCRKNQCPLATSLRAHLLILKTLLIRRDLLIKHAVGYSIIHVCMQIMHRQRTVINSF